MQSYPICLVHLERRTAIVVGGGLVAERKVAGLLEAGARVTVIAPEPTAQLHAWAEVGAITLNERAYCPGDLAGGFLVVVATDDLGVNQAVCDEARACGCLINSVEQPERSDFILPAVLRRGEIAVAIGTGGASPALARHLRERIAQIVGPEYAAAAALLTRLRPRLVARYPDPKARAAAVDGLLAAGWLDHQAVAGPAAAWDYALDALGLAEAAQPPADGGRLSFDMPDRGGEQ